MICPPGHDACWRWWESTLYITSPERICRSWERWGAAGCFLLEFAAGEGLRFGNTYFFFPVFLSLNLVHHIEYQASKRREKMGF